MITRDRDLCCDSEVGGLMLWVCLRAVMGEVVGVLTAVWFGVMMNETLLCGS